MGINYPACQRPFVALRSFPSGRESLPGVVPGRPPVGRTTGAITQGDHSSRCALTAGPAARSSAEAAGVVGAPACRADLPTTMGVQ
jgi:hypothetical protein